VKNLWSKILAFLAKLLGTASIAPPEVNGADENIMRWWEVYRARSPWLKYEFVTADGVKRSRQRMTLNMAKVLCSELAGLVLSEPPTVEAGDLVEKIIAKESLWDNLKKTTEYQAAMGGQVLKVGIGKDKTGAAQISLDYVKAANFIPLAWDNSTITEAAFIDRRVLGGKTIARIETHRKGEGGSYTITNKAFDTETGIEIPLSRIDETLEEETTVKIEMPLFAYIRNPEANNIEPESPLGISIFANAMDTLQVIDLSYDGFKTELLSGRQRIALPGTVMRGYIDANGIQRRGFDPTDEAYIRVEGDDADKIKPVDLSGLLRVDEYRKAIQTNLDILAVQIGFSAGFFVFDGQSVKTATEVISNNSKTYKTMTSYRDAVDAGLKHTFRVINALAEAYKIHGGSKDDPVITWDDGVIEDRNSKTDYWRGIYEAHLCDQVTAIMQIHGLDEDAAKEMADKINKGRQTATVDTLFPEGL
jgi:A118 family predicted phage portal protein